MTIEEKSIKYIKTDQPSGIYFAKGFSVDIKTRSREEIFAAALECFNKRGYADTTISIIARTAGFSKGGIYHHFKSKRELFLELFLYRVRRYSEQLKSLLHQEESPEKRLQIFMKETGILLKKNEDFYRFCLEFLAMGARDTQIRQVMTSFYKDTLGVFCGIVNDGIDRGKFKPVDSRKVARIIYFLVMGVFFTSLSVDTDFDLSDQISFQTEFLLKGL